MKLKLIAFFLILSTVTFAQVHKNTTDELTKKAVENQATTILNFTSTKDYSGFAANSVYKGDDLKRKWKAVKDTANAEDIKDTKVMMKKIEQFLTNCSDKKFDKFSTEKESEGVWYVYTYKCSNGKKLHLAFLRIDGYYLLGDVNIE